MARVIKTRVWRIWNINTMADILQITFVNTFSETKIWSLAAPEIVKMKTTSTAIDKNFIKMSTFPFSVLSKDAWFHHPNVLKNKLLLLKKYNHFGSIFSICHKSWVVSTLLDLIIWMLIKEKQIFKKIQLQDHETYVKWVHGHQIETSLL